MRRALEKHGVEVRDRQMAQSLLDGWLRIRAMNGCSADDYVRALTQQVDRQERERDNSV